MTAAYGELLGALSRERGVLACMVVDAADDIIIDAVARHGVKSSTVAALGASLYRKARQSSGAARLGEVRFLRLEAERGHVFAAGRGGMVLVLLAEPGVNVGLVRVEMLRSAEALS
ncbi:MAG TPA: roadblock/LC7 domain-containing protein [Gemmatimonadaceae bacterium]|nr:roadblock/LC7 domain-containing protein [Gemmatimonadaceae bacterium]